MAKNKREAIKELTELGLSQASAQQAYAALGRSAPAQVSTNPYRLVHHLERTRWQELDTVAQRLGFQEFAPERRAGAVLYALKQSQLDGHVYLPQHELYQRLNQILAGGHPDDIEQAVEALRQAEELAVQNERIYLRSLYLAERSIAQRLKRLFDSASRVALKKPSADEIRQVENELDIQLAAAQREAVEASMQHKIVIITGGPGTGKTTIIRGILHLWEKHGVHMALAAPTGRAAKRLRESTGRSRACTIHRLLEYCPESRTFSRNADRKLKADLLVIDEASMIDTELMASLLVALPDACHIVLVGDVDQLPAVGPGYVLHDLIAGQWLKTIHLQQIFRQQSGSLISINAQKINRGEFPETSGDGIESGQDFFFICRNDALGTEQAILEMAANRIPQQFGLDPKLDIQILSPMYKRHAGVDNLNRHLQQTLTPAEKRQKAAFYVFSTGDKVMQIKNDYSKDVYNGDIGFVLSANKRRNQVCIAFDGEEKIFSWEELGNTTLAYAITVHKAQGSEYPAIVVPLVTQHYPMLQRNLLYTAVSRGKQLVVLIGQRKALEMAVHNNKHSTRYTSLQNQLQTRFAE